VTTIETAEDMLRRLIASTVLSQAFLYVHDGVIKCSMEEGYSLKDVDPELNRKLVEFIGET
jgi:hypothetical protein